MTDRRAGVLLAVVGAATVPWALWLAYYLPSNEIARHWDLAWAGFDVILAAALLATGIALLTGHPAGARTLAAATGALLIADAWLDLVTSAPGGDRWFAIVLAVAGEIPLAILCFVLARPPSRR